MTFVPRTLGHACGCDAPQNGAKLISIDAALLQIAHHAQPVKGVERVVLHAAGGRTLASPVRAQADMPRFDHAAMDGYALCADALSGPGPWRLPVVTRQAAGQPPDNPLPRGAAARIFTGAPLPQGADTVVMQESVTNLGASIQHDQRPRTGTHIRRKGEERRKGQVILDAGTALTARAIAACAASGHGAVTVRRTLRVTLLVSGTEVAAPGLHDLGQAQIWDVNTPMLRTQLARPDIHLIDVVTRDDAPAAIRTALANAARQSDLIITTGGVSVGDEDHLRPAVADLGGDIHFAGVAMKPGKPLAFGQIGSALWLGLPGNPFAAFATWHVFGPTILAGLSGRASQPSDRQLAVIDHPITRKPGRCEVRPATRRGLDGTGREHISCPTGTGSGQVAGLALTDGLAFLPAEADHLPTGALVEFLPF